jgi:hypothetical protein
MQITPFRRGMVTSTTSRKDVGNHFDALCPRSCAGRGCRGWQDPRGRVPQNKGRPREHFALCLKGAKHHSSGNFLFQRVNMLGCRCWPLMCFAHNVSLCTRAGGRAGKGARDQDEGLCPELDRGEGSIGVHGRAPKSEASSVRPRPPRTQQVFQTPQGSWFP